MQSNKIHAKLQSIAKNLPDALGRRLYFHSKYTWSSFILRRKTQRLQKRSIFYVILNIEDSVNNEIINEVCDDHNIVTKIQENKASHLLSSSHALCSARSFCALSCSSQRPLGSDQ